MNRLTIKDKAIRDNFNAEYAKLADLEDIEEERGIDLITLFSEYMVKLSNGETYCFYPPLRLKIRTVESVQDEDWKTVIAQDKEEIPANTELEVLDVLTNFYGRWLKVIYKGLHYYINPSKVEYVGSIERN